MYIRLLHKKVLYVFLSLIIVIAPTIQAHAVSSWAITKAVSVGARTVVNVTNTGYKSAVNISPNIGRIGVKLLKGANQAAIVYTLAQLALDATDVVLDPANNRIKFKTPPENPYYWSATYSGITDAPTYQAAAQLMVTETCRLNNYYSCTAPYNFVVENENRVKFSYDTKNGASSSPHTSFNYASRSQSPPKVNRFLPITNIADQLIKNAANGHAPSQEVTKAAAIEAVIAGDFDADLLRGAVPTSDNRPLIPAVPGKQVGDVGNMTGGDVGAAADSSKAAADSAKAAADAAKAASDAAKDDARAAADAAKDLINTGVDQAIKDAAKATADAAADAAADAKAVSDAAANASSAAAAEAKRAADAMAAAADKAAADARAAADATAESIAAADAAAAQARAAAKAAKEAADAAAAAKPEAKPFELPAFCSWASVVCDYTIWVKDEYSSLSRWLKEEPVTNPAELMPIDDDVGGLGGIFQDKAEAGYVSFESACPADVLIPIDLMGSYQVLNISYTPFCHFASLIRHALILGAWISGLLIVTGGRSRE